MELSLIRQAIIDRAEFWASPGVYKPTPEDLIGFFERAQCEQKPSLADAQKSLKLLGSGCYLGTAVRQWCGIFACSVLADVGVGIRWTLNGGKPMSAAGGVGGVTVKWTNAGMKPGDIAVVHQYQHHFIVTDIDYASGKMNTVDGNQSGNTIRDVVGKSISNVYAHYSFLD